MKQLLAIILVIALVIIAGCAKQGTTAKPSAADQTPAPTAQTALSKTDIAALNITTSSPSWNAGDRVTIYPVIKNLGPAVKGVEVGFYADDKLVKLFNLDFGKSETKSPLYEWYPDNAGKYELKIVVDPNGKLQEANENNNEAATSVVIS